MYMNGYNRRKNSNNPVRVRNPDRVGHDFKYLAIVTVLLTLLFSGCSAPRQISAPDLYGLAMATQIISLPGSEAGRAKVAFVTEIRYPELLFQKCRQAYTAELELSFALKDRKNGQPVFLKDRTKTVRVKSFAETTDRNRLVRMIEYAEVPAGEYRAIIVAQDRAANNSGRVSKIFAVEDFYSRFTLTGPLLSSDSLDTLKADKLLPNDKSRYVEDFYGVVVVGGLQPDLALVLEYEIQDESGVTLFEGKRIFDHPQKITTISFRIPASKLTIGTNILHIHAVHGDEELDASTGFENYLDTESLTSTAIESIIEPMRYIMEEEEWQALENVPETERGERVRAFWDARKPVPAESENPLLKEFVMRVEEANERFKQGGLQGWRTDRGRIHILYGPPDEIKREQTSKQSVYEIWRYEETGRQFVFQDLHGDGDFRLISEPVS